MTREKARNIIKDVFGDTYNEKDLIMDFHGFFGLYTILIDGHNISYDISVDDNRIRKNIHGIDSDCLWNDVTIIDWEDRKIDKTKEWDLI